MKVKVSTRFLKANLNIKDGDLITFKSEGEEGVNQSGRQILNMLVENPDSDEKTLTVNNTSKANMIKLYGDDTANWVGKEARVNIIKQMVGKEMKEVIYLTAPNIDFEGNVISE